MSSLRRKVYLSAALLAAYQAEVEESRILTPEDADLQGRTELEQVLISCRKHARRQFAVCHTLLLKIFADMSAIEQSIILDIDALEDTSAGYRNHWQPVFTHFHVCLGNIFKYSQEQIIDSFSRKVRRINNFCICLFGRTKVGKSTTMEALTRGPGYSIGIGRQNTTRDVREYRWNGLVVVDTPGIDAMDRIDGLEKEALAFADESDMILFLLPHCIEEGDFEKFSRFYIQHKPMLILFNVKKDCGEKGSKKFRDFLDEGGINPKYVAGYVERTSEFILSRLNVDPVLVPMVAVHSRAAHLAEQEDDPETARRLRELSNFDAFEAILIDEVRSNAELYRIRNPYDSLILFCEHVRSQYECFIGTLDGQRKLFLDSLSRYQKVKESIVVRLNCIFDRKIVRYLENKKLAVPGVIDRLFDERDEKKRSKILEEFLPKSAIDLRIKDCAKDIGQMINESIQFFFAEFSRRLDSLHIQMKTDDTLATATGGLQTFESLTETEDVLQGAGVAASVAFSLGSIVVLSEGAVVGAAGTLFGLGSSQIWNPVGWALLGGSVVLGIWSFLKGKEAKEKRAKAKRHAQVQLQTEIDSVTQTARDDLNKWSNEILNSVDREHIQVMTAYAVYAKKHLDQTRKLIDDISFTRNKAIHEKYAAMLRFLSGVESLEVFSVAEATASIEITVCGKLFKKTASMEKKLSRVEEKHVTIMTETTDGNS